MDTVKAHLEPEAILEALETIKLAREEAAAIAYDPGDVSTLTVNPESVGDVYGVTGRAILRYMAKGRDYFVNEVQHKHKQWSPAYALAPAGVSLAAFDLYMFEIESCLDDGQKIARCYQSPAMVKRHPCAKLFSLTLLRKCFKAWSEEYHQRDERGDGAEVHSYDLVKIPKAL